MAVEGQTAIGPNGERAVFQGGQWVIVAAPSQGPSVTPLPESPSRIADRERDDAAASRDETRTGIAVREEGRKVENTGKDYLLKLSNDYNADPAVKAYRVAIGQFGQALGTGTGAQADLALTYAFAKAMDPDSVVREAEQGMVTESQPWFQQMVERTKKQFGMDGAGNYTPETREALRKQISNSVAQRAKVYDARRHYYEQQAQAIGVDPGSVLGQHDATPFVPMIQQWVERVNNPQQLSAQGQGEDGLVVVVSDDTPSPYDPGGPFNPTTPNQYHDSYLGQGMSGLNEGIASILGAPADLAATAMNLVPQGLNAVANTNIPTIDNPVMGSDWFKDRMSGWGIYEPTADPSKQFTRRVGESIGAAAVPAGFAGTLPRIASAITAGAGGGVGAATAQQAFPNSPLAELAGDVIGGGATGAGLARFAQSRAQGAIEAAIPSVDDLKQQAGALYRQAEQRGQTAGPMQTQQLATDMQTMLRREGQLGPAGKITDADTNTSKAHNLIEQYSGLQMTPKEMDTVRGVIADGRKSPDASDQRLAKVMLEEFDAWADPQAPEFSQAREIASRYLQAEDLEQARELANVDASRLTQSGLENAIRGQYRLLDRNSVKGREWFTPEVSGAIEKVSRGTPASNIARAIGRFAPQGPVATGMSVFAPAGLGGYLGGTTGAALGASLGLAGIAGRTAATGMTRRAADVAELTARNGGSIPQAPLLSPEQQRLVDNYIAAEAAKYLTQDDNPEGTEPNQIGSNPNPLARREGKKPLSPRGLFAAR